MAQQLKALFQRIQVWFPASVWKEQPYVPLVPRPLQVPRTYIMCKHMCRQNAHVFMASAVISRNHRVDSLKWWLLLPCGCGARCVKLRYPDGYVFNGTLRQDPVPWESNLSQCHSLGWACTIHQRDSPIWLVYHCVLLMVLKLLQGVAYPSRSLSQLALIGKAFIPGFCPSLCYSPGKYQFLLSCRTYFDSAE